MKRSPHRSFLFFGLFALTTSACVNAAPDEPADSVASTSMGDDSETSTTGDPTTDDGQTTDQVPDLPEGGSTDTDPDTGTDTDPDTGTDTDPDTGMDTDPDTSTDTDTDGGDCGYPEGAVEPMTLDEVLTPYAWPEAIRADGTVATLDLAHAPCATDEVIDWSIHDLLVFISVPAW